MKTVIISIDKKTLVPLFRSRVYKIAESLANDENFKTIYNIEHDSSDVLDSLLSDRYFEKRVINVSNIVAEYILPNPSGELNQIYLSVPSASIATSENASNAASEYILCGMIADWIKDTVPTLLKQYEAAAISAEEGLKRVIYTKKAPEL